MITISKEEEKEDDDINDNAHDENSDHDDREVVEKKYDRDDCENCYIHTFSSLASSNCPLSAMMTCLELSSVFFSD